MTLRRLPVGLVLWAAAAALLLLLSEPAAAQCAMCKTVVNGSAEGQAVSSQLNHAILVMLAAPYVVFTVLAAVIFRKPLGERWTRWRARARAV